MKKLFYIFTLSIFLSLFPSSISAQTETVYIEDFQTEIEVLQNGEVNVTEEILYVFNEARHGMYRTIPTSYQLEDGSTQHLAISVNSVNYKSVVTDSVYNQYTTSRDNNYVNVKIGDPNTYIQGKYLYTISYTIKYLIENYNNMDKLYFNVIGDEWEDPIYHASAKVAMPGPILETNCYTGPKGSTESKCNITNQSSNEAYFNSEEIYRGDRFFTIIATVAPGTIQDLSEEKEQYIPPTSSNSVEDTANSVVKYFSYVFIALIILTIVLIFIYAFKTKDISKYGRTKIKKYLPNTIPQYTIPNGWYILKMDILLNKRTTNGAMTAQIIQLCIYGYLKLVKEGKKLTLYKTEKPTTDLVEPLRLFYEGLMQGNNSVELPTKTSYTDFYDEDFSMFIQMFYHSLKVTQMKIYDELKDGEYFAEEKKKTKFPILIVFVFIFTVIGFIVGFMTSKPMISFGSFGVGFLLMIILSVVSSFRNKPDKKPKYTEKGEEIVRHIHGLHMYIDTAEEERIEFHNDPEKYKGIFEALLPYAIIFGLEEKWVKVFNIHNLLWFNSTDGSEFDIGEITSSITSFAYTATATFSSSSGGGSSSGSSGGGGGGGGGGSW